MIHDVWNNPDPLQKLIDFSQQICIVSRKYHQNPFITFWDILHTDTSGDTPAAEELSSRSVIRSFTCSGLETSTWSPPCSLDRPASSRHWFGPCQYLETSCTAKPWWSDATARAGYAITTATTTTTMNHLLSAHFPDQPPPSTPLPLISAASLSLISSATTSSFFHSKLKTYLFYRSLSPQKSRKVKTVKHVP